MNSPHADATYLEAARSEPLYALCRFIAALNTGRCEETIEMGWPVWGEVSALPRWGGGGLEQL